MLPNIPEMMKKLQEIQKNTARLQEEIKSIHVTSTSGLGLVVLTMNGAYDIISIELKDNPDTDMALEIGDIPSLIIAAYNDARKKIKDISEEKMKSLTSGISLPPGMKMPGLF